MNRKLSSENDFVDLLKLLKQAVEDHCRRNLGWENQNDWSRIAEEVVVAKLGESLITKGLDPIGLEKHFGKKFPDVTVFGKFGIEIKTAKKKSWSTTGNSVNESSRVHGVEAIYLFFIKAWQGECEVRFESYEKCLSDFTVTHSPRYKIDLDCAATIHEKLGTSYLKFRELENPRGAVVDYYESEGSSSHWFCRDRNSNGYAPDPRIRFWSEMESCDQQNLKSALFSRFPEVVKKKTNYNSAALWLTIEKGIVCPSLRDLFSAGRNNDVRLRNGRIYRVRSVIKRVQKLILSIQGYLSEVEECWDSSRWSYKFDHNEDIIGKWRTEILRHIEDPEELEFMTGLFEETELRPN